MALTDKKLVPNSEVEFHNYSYFIKFRLQSCCFCSSTFKANVPYTFNNFYFKYRAFFLSNLILPIAPLPIGIPEYAVYGTTSEYKFKLSINKTILGKLISSLSYLKVLGRNFIPFSTQRNDNILICHISR